MSEGGEKGKGKEKEPLQLDAQALEAIIQGVASKLREECKGRKPGEHSGSETASSSSGTGGSSLIWLITTRHPHSTRSGVKTYGELHLHVVLMTS